MQIHKATEKCWYIAKKNNLIHHGELETGLAVRTGFPTLDIYIDENVWKIELLKYGINPDAVEEESYEPPEPVE
jgi:hypothetical protein